MYRETKRGMGKKGGRESVRVSEMGKAPRRDAGGYRGPVKVRKRQNPLGKSPRHGAGGCWNPFVWRRSGEGENVQEEGENVQRKVRGEAWRGR